MMSRMTKYMIAGTSRKKKAKSPNKLNRFVVLTGGDAGYHF